MTLHSQMQEGARRTWRAAMPLFERWVDADETQRAALIARSAAENPDIHAQLLRLIAADDESERAAFLDGNAMADAAADAEPALRDLAGERIGAWRLQRLLGVGGSGQVWLAQRCDGLHEGVAALKLLRAAATDPRAEQRFAREGRLLARLRHAHIARLLDAGQIRPEEGTGDQRYLVLEYVDGERIDQWCDQHNATVQTRLRLFLQVCDAIVYAHANLIVHRDLKPSNILVQADGVAKLLDFGVAKLLETGGDTREPAETTELTRAGGAPFTPEYAAPEQFEHEPATVATDVYSLGVVLYALLAGRRPYVDAATTPVQLARAVVDGTATRLSLAVDDKTRDTRRIARHRGTTPLQLRRMLRGDLDTILGKALKRNPGERYASVQAFADDLRRFLDRRPIRAHRDSRVYVARKFIGRHRPGVVLACVALILLFGAGVVLLVQAQRLRAEATRASTIKEFVLEAFRSADAYAANGKNATDAITMLQKAARDLDAKPGMDDETRAEMYAAFAEIFKPLGSYTDARDNYRKAAELYARMYGDRSPRALAVEAGAISNKWQHGNLDGLLPRIDHLLATIGTEATPDLQRIRWSVLDSKVVIADSLGDLPMARTSAERYVAEVAAAAGTQDYRYSYALWRLATVWLDAGAPRETDRLMREVIALDRRLVPPKHPGLVTDLQTTVDVLLDYGNYREAEPIAEAALALRQRQFDKRHHTVVETTWSVADIAAALGQDRVAETDFAAALASAVQIYAPHARALAGMRYDFGMYLVARVRLDEASAQFAACARVFDDAPDAWNWQRAACAASAAYCAAHAGDAKAIATLDRLIAEQRQHQSRELPAALWLRARLAAEHIAADSAQRQLAWLDEAEALLDHTGRGGSQLAHGIESARIALGATAFELHPEPGRALIEAANAIIVAAQ